MKVLHLSTQDWNGGAARAAHDLHTGLQDENVDVSMLVKEKATQNDTIKSVSNGLVYRVISRCSRFFDRLPLRIFYKKQNLSWTTGFFSIGLGVLPFVKRGRFWPQLKRADLITLFWVQSGFLSLQDIGKILGLNKPVIWRLSDMWAFTGGCNYSFDCKKYLTACGACPTLDSNKETDISFRTLQSKTKTWVFKNLTVVCPSHWLADQVKRSHLMKGVSIKVIPTGINVSVFKPTAQEQTRQDQGYAPDDFIVLIGAQKLMQDKRKGAVYAFEALKTISSQYSNVKVVTFGSDDSSSFEDSGLNFNNEGYINNPEELAKIYSLADCFIAPSLNENLPKAVMEAMSCETPVVAFKSGGIPEIIDHKINGYLAEIGDSQDLASGIEWVITNRDKHQLRQKARQKILDVFDQKDHVRAYKNLYEQLYQEFYT